MSGSNVFGPIISAELVEGAVAEFMGAPAIRQWAEGGELEGYWLDTYLQEMERIAGYAPNSLARPRGILTASEFEKWPEDQLPVVVVIVPGLAGPPQRQGDSSYRAEWAVGVSAVVSDTQPDGNSTAATRRMAQTYAAAIRALVMEHKSLGGMADSLVWMDERYDDLGFDDSRTLMAGRVVFKVGVASVVRESDGPSAPLPPADTEDPDAPPPVDPGPWPPFTDVRVDVDLRSPTEALT